MSRQERCEKCGHTVEFQVGNFQTICEIKYLNRRNGGHWFDAESMRFFKSRIASEVIGGKYFISSEQFIPYEGNAEPRKYTIRIANEKGEISEIGEFQKYLTLRAARKAADKLK